MRSVRRTPCSRRWEIVMAPCCWHWREERKENAVKTKITIFPFFRFLSFHIGSCLAFPLFLNLAGLTVFLSIPKLSTNLNNFPITQMFINYNLLKLMIEFCRLGTNSKALAKEMGNCFSHFLHFSNERDCLSQALFNVRATWISQN